MTKLYHASIFVPNAMRQHAACLTFRKLIWSRHAQLELINDKYGMIPRTLIPGQFQAHVWELVEIEATNDTPTKFVFRQEVDAVRSLVIVLRPRCHDEAWVITCWTNRNADTHRSLDRSKYAEK